MHDDVEVSLTGQVTRDSNPPNLGKTDRAKSRCRLRPEMRRRLRLSPGIFVSLLVLLVMIAIACGAQPVHSEELSSSMERAVPSADDAILEELAQGNSAFAFDLYSQLAPDEGNLFFSPYSISLALAMTYAGARGETERQMAEVLHFLPQDAHHVAFNSLDSELASRGEVDEGEMEGDAFELSIANAVWGQKDYRFLQPFLDTLAENYGSGVKVTDFRASPEGARKTINDWVEERTEERIKDLIPPDAITDSSRMALANAIYFNATWAYPFVGKTRRAPFHLLDGSSKNVPMMNIEEEFGYSNGDGYEAVNLPYNGGMSMIVIVPDSERFREFEGSLDAELVSRIVEDLSIHEVTLKMPKFEFESEFKLSETLRAMGMPNAFGTSVDSDADFSGMDGRSCIVGDRPCLYISEIFHKAFVLVNEEGTEAAAATAVSMEVILSAQAPPPRVNLTIDRPFIFLIRDWGTDTILFIGRVEVF